MPDNRTRVAVVGGELPRDPRYLQIASADVDLSVHRRAGTEPRDAGRATGLRVRDHQLVADLGRGHLAYWYRSLHDALDRDRPDVVHVISEPWGLLAVQAARWVRANRPTKLVMHGCDTLWHHGGRAKQALRRAILGYTTPTIDAWLAESGKALAVARANGLREDCLRLRIHTNPRDETAFRPVDDGARAASRARLAIQEDCLVVGLLGRLVPEKGVDLLLDAADVLRADGFPIHLLIAGDGPLRELVRSRTGATTTYLGTLPHPDGVLSFFAALDVLACPSLTTPNWEDQGPRSVLEGMMCGCVPVATPTGALPEMLDGHGVLAESTDVFALANALRSSAAMARTPEQRLGLAQWAGAQYSATAVAKRLVDLWGELVRTADGPLPVPESA